MKRGEEKFFSATENVQPACQSASLFFPPHPPLTHCLWIMGKCLLCRPPADPVLLWKTFLHLFSRLPRCRNIFHSSLFIISHVPKKNFSSSVLIIMGTFPYSLAVNTFIQWHQYPPQPMHWQIYITVPRQTQIHALWRWQLYTSGNLQSSRLRNLNRQYHTLNISHGSLRTRITLVTIMFSRNEQKACVCNDF
jgi:hypothetical protein